MQQFFSHSEHTDALLSIAAKLGAADRIAAYQYCIQKEWLCGYGRVTDKGFHKVTADFYKDTTAA